jgi:hypothetical protein
MPSCTWGACTMRPFTLRVHKGVTAEEGTCVTSLEVVLVPGAANPGPHVVRAGAVCAVAAAVGTTGALPGGGVYG